MKELEELGLLIEEAVKASEKFLLRRDQALSASDEILGVTLSMKSIMLDDLKDEGLALLKKLGALCYSIPPYLTESRKCLLELVSTTILALDGFY